MSNRDMDVAKKLGLIKVKKNQKFDGQVEIKLDLLYDWIPTLPIFANYL